MTKKICLEPLKSALGLSISHYYQDFTGAGGILAKKSRKHFEWKDMFWTLPYFLVVRITISRSSHRRYSVIEGVLTNFANFTRKHYLCCSFFNKVAGFRPATLIKRDSGTEKKHLFWRKSANDCFYIAYILCMHTLGDSWLIIRSS